jgi:hypothetical protein
MMLIAQNPLPVRRAWFPKSTPFYSPIGEVRNGRPEDWAH